MERKKEKSVRKAEKWRDLGELGERKVGAGAADLRGKCTGRELCEGRGAGRENFILFFSFPILCLCGCAF